MQNSISKMQSLRFATALRLAEAGDCAPAAGILQQLAGFAKEASSKKEASGKKGGGEGGGDGKLQMLLKALEPQEEVVLDLSPEDAAEAERRSKEYSRLKMRQHREWQLDLTTKLKLKQAAVDALPPDLRAAALVPDMEPFPTNRQIWTETPPHEEKADGAADRQQVRTARTIGTKRR